MEDHQAFSIDPTKSTLTLKSDYGLGNVDTQRGHQTPQCIRDAGGADSATRTGVTQKLEPHEHPPSPPSEGRDLDEALEFFHETVTYCDSMKSGEKRSTKEHLNKEKTPNLEGLDPEVFEFFASDS